MQEKIPSLDEIISTAKTMEQYEKVEQSQKAILENIKKEKQPEKAKPKQPVPSAQGPTKKPQTSVTKQRKPKQHQPQPQRMGPAAFQGPFDSGFYMPSTSHGGHGMPQAPRAFGTPFSNYPRPEQTFPRETAFMPQLPPPYSKEKK